MRKELAEVGDFKIGQRIINKARVVDDTAVKAKTQKKATYVEHCFI